MRFTKKQIIQEVFSLRENPQLMDKYYIKTGILDNSDRDYILGITNGDHFTKFVSDLYAFWKKRAKLDEYILKMIKDCYNDLVNYNANLFPVGGLDPMNANAERPFKNHPRGLDILSIVSALTNRRSVLKLYKGISELYLRNLRDDIRKPRDQYELEKLSGNINNIIRMMNIINKNNPDNAKKIYEKVFSSKNDTFEKVSEFIINIKEYLVSDADSVEELMHKLYICDHSKLISKDEDDGVYVVKVGSQSDMQELGCGSLWCFATSSDKQWWEEYADGKSVYLIYDFKKPRNSPQRMMVKLPSGEYYDMYNEPSDYDYDVYISKQPNQKKKNVGVSKPKVTEPPIEPINAQGQYQMQLAEMKKLSLLEIVNYHTAKHTNEKTPYMFDEIERECISRAVSDVIKGVEHETWVKIDFPRLVKIWNDYVKTNFVRDERGVDEISERLIENIAQLSANYRLMEENIWKEEIQDQYCFKEPEVEPDPDYVPPDPVDPKQLKLKYRDDKGKFWSAYPPQEKQNKKRWNHGECIKLDMTEEEFEDRLYNYVTMVSDYATTPLIRLAYQLIEAQEAEKKLIICDNILNVIHANGDLASLFVEGGSRALSALSGEHTSAIYHPYNWGSPFSTYTNEPKLKEEILNIKRLIIY